MAEFTARPELCGTVGAVASTHWIASAVGMRLLEMGGNAFDAAVAAGFTLQIVEPHLNGPGGDAPILAARAGDPEPTVICGQGPSPAAATIAAFADRGLDMIPGTGLLAACVPGAFGAWLVLLRDFGTVALRDVLEPAIHYARTGHPVLAGAVAAIASVERLFADEWTSSARLYLPGGVPPAAGSLFANPLLADFYDRLLAHAEAAAGGRAAQIEAALAYWYEGPVAEAIDAFMRGTEAMDTSGRRHRGLLCADDMAGWRPPIERPIGVDHGEHRLYKCGAWSQGPALLQAVQIAKGLDIGAMPLDSADYVHAVCETIKLAMADRDAWYGEAMPDGALTALLGEAYAAERRTLIGDTASHDQRPGAPAGLAPRLPPACRGSRGETAVGGGEPTMAKELALPVGIDAHQRGDTCHVDVVDRWGNMVSATPSGGWLQSSPAIPGLGFALGTRMQMFWLAGGLPGSLAPGVRPRTTLTPSLAYRGGRPYLAFGTPGGDQQDQWSLQLWLAHVVHGRPLQAAIEAPAFHTEHMFASFWPREVHPGSLIVESRFPQTTVDELRRRGHALTVGGPWSEGRLSACAHDFEDGRGLLRAAANPRGMQGYAIAR
jgi:gamma-glutamyltranspeptidase/glutathione hydrolase